MISEHSIVHYLSLINCVTATLKSEVVAQKTVCDNDSNPEVIVKVIILIIHVDYYTNINFCL